MKWRDAGFHEAIVMSTEIILTSQIFSSGLNEHLISQIDSEYHHVYVDKFKNCFIFKKLNLWGTNEAFYEALDTLVCILGIFHPYIVC